MRRIFAALTIAVAASHGVAAQTDYYNTDRGRPLRIEDAYPVEFRAIELQAAPLRFERARAGAYSWAIEPELAVGLFPRTQIEVGIPLALVEQGGGRSSTGLAGIGLSVLRNLNAETALPAFAIAADARLPVGAFSANRAYVSGTGIMTRTFPWARFHINAQYTAGSAPDTTLRVLEEPSRWLAGVAVDKTYPLSALLVSAEVFASRPMRADDPVEWTAGTGLRYQISPRWAMDAGLGRRFTGFDPSWYVTFGTAYAIGLPWRGPR